MRIYPHEITRARKNLERCKMYHFMVTNAKDGKYLPGPCPIGFENPMVLLWRKVFGYPIYICYSLNSSNKIPHTPTCVELIMYVV